jgi:hypothetical protein
MRLQFCHGLIRFFAGILMFGSSARAGVFWDESINGDLSNNQSGPNQFTLASGVNTLIGTVGGAAGSQDWFTLTVPANFQFQSIIPRAYSSSDATAFIGFQDGSSFVGDPNSSASLYRGYGHIGPGSGNALNVDMMPAMGAAPGAQGFTPPLGPGSYTFLIQQLGSQTSYQFDFTAIPEVRGQAAVAIFCAAFLLRRRWRLAKAAQG